MVWSYNGYTITDETEMVDILKVHTLLSSTYWAAGRTVQQVEDSLPFSICFSIFKDDEQIGFGRVVTDHVLFAWIADIVIHPDHRAKGLGTFLMNLITQHPDIPQHMQLLRTKDAHGLYEKFNFKRDECMIRRNPASPENSTD